MPICRGRSSLLLLVRKWRLFVRREELGSLGRCPGNACPAVSRWGRGALKYCQGSSPPPPPLQMDDQLQGQMPQHFSSAVTRSTPMPTELNCRCSPNSIKPAFHFHDGGTPASPSPYLLPFPFTLSDGFTSIPPTFKLPFTPTIGLPCLFKFPIGPRPMAIHTARLRPSSW